MTPALGALLEAGVRLGESTVASTRVHLLTPTDPDAVLVLTDRDAGQTFYGRARAGEIVHLDVFHAPGAVPPAAVAEALRRALAPFPGSQADLFDVQTALGGGRATGDLRGGRRPSLLAAHRGHVHLAGRLGVGQADRCLRIVDAVERAITGAGLELRKPQRVLAAPVGPDGERALSDLRDYSALTDSHLRASGSGHAPGTGPGEWPRTGGAGHGAGAGQGCGAAGAGAALEQRLLQAAALAEDLGGAEAARGVLEALAQPLPLASIRLPACPGGTVRDVLARLVQGGLVAPSGTHWRLTPAGEALRATFARRLREVELALRTAARQVATRGGTELPPGVRAGCSHRAAPRGAVAPGRGERLVELAVAETALAAAGRSAAGGEPLRIRAADLRLRRRHRSRRVDLCLLLDASASMEGGRMRAAKTLARHLLLTGRDRMAVMAFQERAATLAVPLTRNYAAAERGLRRVVPAGLTPLAAGLAGAREYLRRTHAHHALLLLVTDGIPTVSGGQGSPLEEALREAERLRGSGIAVCCIGLEPNEHYLGELARRAGGRLHVVAELRPEVLAAVARHERLRRAERPARPAVPP